MAETLINKLAEFACNLQFSDLPEEVVLESKRVILDSIGCTLGGATHDKGKIGLQFARQMGGRPEATVIGFGEKMSAMSAAFANGELMNALDFDSVLPPGHVVPYTIPPALAIGELQGSSGKDLILTTAISHEISNRFGKAMDYLRDVKDGEVCPPEVFGFSATIFGATASIGKLKGFNPEVLSNALAIAAYNSSVNTERSWIEHGPPTTIKYQHAGWLSMGSIVSAGMAELGHRGDLLVLENDGFGWPKMIGTKKWEPEVITNGLGENWVFPASLSFKHYPHCRVLAAPLDALIHLVEEHNIKVEEIESINAWVEEFCMRPLWFTKIEHVTDGQFNMAHALSVAAHRVLVGPAWQDESTVFNPSILALMDKITFDVDPDYVESLIKNPSARKTRIQIKARGQVFTEERHYPKGSPSPLEETYSTMDELVAKFKVNAERILPVNKIEPAVNALLSLEEIKDIRELMKKVSL